MDDERRISYGDFPWLICPGCGGDYLHHDRVAIFSRDEDAANTKFTLVENDGAVTQKTRQSVLSGNPSPRRDGVTITFSCETCSDRLLLVIYQHKGRTNLSWIVNE